MKIRVTGAAEYGRFIKALICGPAGSGKTLISSTWPNPFYGAAEANFMSVADRALPYTPIETSQDLLALKGNLSQEPKVRADLFGRPVDTIIIDTIDEVQKIFIRERLKETKQDGMRMQDWGWLNETMSAVLSGFRNLDMNVVFTCHTKELSDDDSNRVYYKPALQGGTADNITNIFSLNLLLRSTVKTEVVDGEPQRTIIRYIQTFPDRQHDWIKDHSGKLPHEFPVNFHDDFQRMHDLIYANVESLPNEPDVTIVDEPPVVESQPSITVEETEDLPKTVVTPPPVAKAPEAPKPQTEGAYTCEECGSTDLDKTQYDLSRIKYRKIMCRPCFKAKKAS